jgi:hypothetical protein
MVSFHYINLYLPIMLIEEEEPKGGDLNPDALEAVFEEDVLVDEELIVFNSKDEDEEADEIDIAFAANDEGYW